MQVHDPLRVNQPNQPFGLQPLQWGAVTPQGWLRDWAMAAANGAASPTAAAFATLNDGYGDGFWAHGHGRPSIGGFWDEDAAYWIDGMTRLGLVLHDSTLLARVKQDYDFVLAHPYQFHNTWQVNRMQPAVYGWTCFPRAAGGPFGPGLC